MIATESLKRCENPVREVSEQHELEGLLREVICPVGEGDFRFRVKDPGGDELIPAEVDYGKLANNLNYEIKN